MRARTTTPWSRGEDASAAGFSLIHVLVATAILAIAALSLSAVQVQSLSLSTSNRETALARQVARQLLEQVREVPPAEVYATFNTDPADDPVAAGTAPGPTILQDGPGGITGQVIFPGGLTATTLREDVTDARLGMPRDLNGDGVIDAANHAADFRLLPVRIRVRWTGVTGVRTLELHTVLLNQ